MNRELKTVVSKPNLKNSTLKKPRFCCPDFLVSWFRLDHSNTTELVKDTDDNFLAFVL